MSDFDRIETLVRQARLQRSAMLGELLGQALAGLWQATARNARRAVEAVQPHVNTSPAKVVTTH
jgi:hypothetical protein